MGETVIVDGFYNHDTGDVEITQREYIGDILQENLDKQKDGSNGWTEDRSMRLVGSIPWSLYADHNFRSLNRDERTIFLRWFLEQHPECRTVDKFLHVGPSDGHIIIK
jgi:hypothetical protein